MSHSSSHTGACSPLSRHVGRQPSTESIDIPVPTLFGPAIDTSPPNDARRPIVETSSPLSPLGLTGIIPVTHEIKTVASGGFLGIDQQTDILAPNRGRRASDSPSSRALPPLPEDPLNSDIQVPFKSSIFQSTTREKGKPARPSTAPSPSAHTPSPDLRRADSSSSQSTSSTSISSKVRIRLFGNKRSQGTPDTSPGVNSDSILPGASSQCNPSFSPGAPPAKRPSPIGINLPQSRNWEPVSPVVLRSMEVAASDSEGLLQPATDGTVSSGNLEGLVSRVIKDIEDPSRNDHFRETFLTIYQLFTTSPHLFHILKRRFESSELDPVAARSRYSWVNNIHPLNEY